MTTALIWNDVTGSSTMATTVEQSALGCQERRAITAWPPGLCMAPTMKSVWPPKPEWIRASILEAFAWPKRSTCRAVLTLVIAGLRAIRPGSLVTSVRAIRTRSLPSTQVSSSSEPKTKEAVIGAERSSAPARSRRSTESENISLHTRSPRRPTRPLTVASGTAPMPVCNVAPSGTRAATSSPMRAASGPTGASGAVISASSASTTTSTWSRSSSESPKVHGTCRETCATTTPPRRRTCSTAAGSTLTSVPIETRPCRGGVVCRTTASGGTLEAKSVGTIESREGT